MNEEITSRVIGYPEDGMAELKSTHQTLTHKLCLWNNMPLEKKLYLSKGHNQGHLKGYN